MAKNAQPDMPAGWPMWELQGQLAEQPRRDCSDVPNLQLPDTLLSQHAAQERRPHQILLAVSIRTRSCAVACFLPWLGRMALGVPLLLAGCNPLAAVLLLWWGRTRADRPNSFLRIQFEACPILLSSPVERYLLTRAYDLMQNTSMHAEVHGRQVSYSRGRSPPGILYKSKARFEEQTHAWAHLRQYGIGSSGQDPRGSQLPQHPRGQVLVGASRSPWAVPLQEVFAGWRLWVQPHMEVGAVCVAARSLQTKCEPCCAYVLSTVSQLFLSLWLH